MEQATEKGNLMDKDAYLEANAAQQPALDLLQVMGYAYISPA